MRKFTLLLLLASSATPAMAQRSDDGDGQSRRALRAEQSDNRPQRAERTERREAREQPQREVQVERQQSDRRGSGPPVQAMRERYQQAQQAQQAQLAQQGGQQGQSARSERLQRYQQRQVQQQVQGEAARGGGLERFRQRQIEARQQAQGGGLVPRQSRIRTIPGTTPEVGQQGPVRQDVRVGTRHDRYDRNRWSNHWRNDNRYDWRRYRDRNRSIFRIGFYYDPFGYSYRRFGIGSYLYSNYYQSNFWINDPWQYRLPPAYGPYRWVRYHNDAILIDTWTGEVVDVIYSFFW